MDKERQFLKLMLNDKANDLKNDFLIPHFLFYQFEKEMKMNRKSYETLVRRLNKDGYIEIEMKNSDFENALISIKSKAILLLLSEEEV